MCYTISVKREGEKIMTIEKLCEMLGIVGIVHYFESETTIVIERGGKTYMYKKDEDELVVFDY